MKKENKHTYDIFDSVNTGPVELRDNTCRRQASPIAVAILACVFSVSLAIGSIKLAEGLSGTKQSNNTEEWICKKR